MTPLSTYTPDCYADIYRPFTVFDTVDFARLNSLKASELAFVGDGRFGLILGRRDDGCWHAPFSAPYSMLSMAGTPAGVTADDLRRFAERLARFADDGLELTPPPEFYCPSVLTPWLSALAEVGCSRIDDVNFHYPLAGYHDYLPNLEPAARRNTRRALASGFSLVTDADPVAAYTLIAAHHEALGYRMAMSLDDVLRTAPLVNADFFAVTLDGRQVAAAIYYPVAQGISQLINWGDELSLRYLRTANFMAYAIFGHYAAQGYRAVDLGPASVNGVHNEGLIRFKRSLGAVASPRANFSL